MPDWRTVQLREVADIRVSNVDKKAVASELPIKLCNYMDVYGNDYIRADLPFMEATATAAEIERFGVRRGDVMITKDSETPDDIGIPSVVLDDIESLVCGYHLAQLRPREAVVDPIYLSKQLSLPETSAYFAQRATGSTRYGLSTRTIAQTPIRLAPLVEQQRIAAILTSLDTAIAAAEALIEKHQQIKAGLMYDLFSRGVSPSGDLRPSPAQAPSLYDVTPLGPLPTDWRVYSLSELLAPVANNLRSGPFGSALLKHELSESGIPLLGIDNVHVERFAPNYSRFVDQRKFLTLARYAVRPRDVIITIMGTVGRCCVVPEDIGTALSSKHLWTMTFDSSRVVPELVCWQLNHAPWARAWFRRGGQGGIMDAIQSSTLKSLKLPVPPMAEQVNIAERYRAIQSRIQADEAMRDNFRMQKQGLMHELLTGKVPVRAD